MSDAKVATVIGGGSGMGAAAAERLATDGFKIAILSSFGKGKAFAKEQRTSRLPSHQTKRSKL